MSIKITVINGPNLNLLHLRDSLLYGNIGLPEIESSLKNAFPDIAFDFFQSNIEGELIEKIQNCIKAHTSVAIHDALELISLPKIEVHLSNIHNRESYRQHSLTAAACHGVIAGLKDEGYHLAVRAILNLSL
jgi:3-dehydroquinate dehydratase-2